MTFTQACEFIRDAKSNYKIIYPHGFGIPTFNFKFELKGRQYDSFDVIYHTLESRDMLPPHDKTSLSKRVRATGLALGDAVTLWHLSNGAMERRDAPPFYRDIYDRRKSEFESITGIKVSR